MIGITLHSSNSYQLNSSENQSNIQQVNSNSLNSHPHKPPVYQSLTGSHGPIGQVGPLLHQATNSQYNQPKKIQRGHTQTIQNACIKENSNVASNLQSNTLENRNSCPTTKLRGSFLQGVASGINAQYNKGVRSSCASQNSCHLTDNGNSRGSSKSFKGDRFIPFRGTSENFIEEYIMNNQIQKQKNTKSTKERSDSRSNNQQQPNSQAQHNPGNGVNSNDQSNYSSNSSNESANNIHYSRGSGHNKKQSFQELITESLFTNRRGSPNTLTAKEFEYEQEEEMIHNVEQQVGSKKKKSTGIFQTQRILSFKEKRPRQTLSLQKNLSLISALAKEKTQLQQKSLRFIPQFPEKILDAPDLVDDYYLNLLDWNSDNILAVCLATTVYLWNSSTGEIQQLFDTENDNDIVTSVSWMKGQSLLAIGTQSKQIQLWDANKFERVKTIENQHEGRVSSLSWNPYYTSLVSSGSLDSLILNNDIRISNFSSLISTFKTHRQEVCGLKWSPDGQQLASGGNDNLLCIWDINSRMRNPFSNPQPSNNPFQPSSFNLNQMNQLITQPKYCFTDHKAAVKALSWCPWQKGLLASGGGSRDQCIKFWNTETGQLVNSVQTDSQVCALQWNPYEKEILSSHGFINNQLCIWKYPTMKKIAELRGHTSRVLHLSLSPDGTTVASAAADETLRFWKVFQQTSNYNIKGQSGIGLCASGDTMMSDACKLIYNTSSLGNGMSLR